jgi:sarcosine oxidase subunit gamma
MRNRVLDRCAIVRVQTWDSQAAAPTLAESALGVEWPLAAGTIVSGRAEVICIGPTDWLLMAAGPDASPLLKLLAEPLAETSFRAADVSSALTRVEVDGPEAWSMLAKGCSLDLHPAHFGPGRAARTRLAGMPVIIRCVSPTTFECIVAASYAEYLTSWLDDAALEFASSTRTAD